MDAETSPFQVNLAYQVPRRKPGDYVGKQELERQRKIIDDGGFPFRQKLVGMTLGGKPITDYAPDFWLVTDTDGTQIGYLTSPWWSPELGTNIALGYVPWEKSAIGTKLQDELTENYSETQGQPVAAVVCEVPFRPSVNPSAREIALADGRDAAD